MIIEKDPICDTCHATCVGGYSWTEQSSGVITKIVCHDCRDRERLDDWRYSAATNLQQSVPILQRRCVRAC